MLIRQVPPQFRNSPFAAAAGCAECKQVGYKGRLGVYEMLRMTPAVQALAEAHASAADITAAARSEGMRSLWESATDKAVQRLTSLEEVMRCV